MFRAMKKAIRNVVYEFIVFGVIFEFLVIVQVLNTNINAQLVLWSWIVIFVVQWAYFYMIREKK